MSLSPLRHDLALPNELLHKVLLSVLSDNIHALCTSTADITWETNMISILHQVSPAFRAISSELAAKAFNISREVRNDDAALLRTLHEKFAYLTHLGAKYRDPSERASCVSFQTIDCTASSFVFAYALYLSCLSLRRHATRSTRDVFESTQNVILSGLEQSETFCARVKPEELTWVLTRSVRYERDLAVLGLNIVQGFDDIRCYADALAVFKMHIEKDGTGPVVGARCLLHKALSKVEGSYESYQDILERNPSMQEPHAYELPGVARGLDRLSTLTIDHDDPYDLFERSRKVVRVWSTAPLFKSNTTGMVIES